MPLAVGGGIGLQVIATILPGLRGILGVTPLGMLDWAIVAGASVTPLLINEIAKGLMQTQDRREMREGEEMR
jgi:Ca2+-transporting ATPase